MVEGECWKGSRTNCLTNMYQLVCVRSVNKATAPETVNRRHHLQQEHSALSPVKMNMFVDSI